MLLIFSLAIKLIPIYLNILLGYISGKLLGAKQDTISQILFYIITPLIIFNGVIHTKITPDVLSLPFLTFTISCALCILFYYLSGKIWRDSSKNIMAFSAGSGATGFFGVPFALMIFDEQAQGIYIMSLLGVALYDNSLGYYISLKGSCSSKQAIKHVLSLPTLYAFILGLVMNLLQIPLPEAYTEFMEPMKGVYVVLGMMIIGIGLADMTKFTLDFKFIGMTFLAKFIAWPMIIFSIIWLDRTYLTFYEPISHQALILLSIVPLAVNTVVMASLIKYEPEKTAVTVFLSNLFALFYVPFMSALFLL